MRGLLVFFACLLLPLGSAWADDNGSPAGDVARAMFTVGIEDREPSLVVEVMPEGMNEVYFYTDLRDFQGQTVTHRWNYNGQSQAEISFDVGGPRWRTWSLKTIPDSQRGEWSVDVIDDEGFIVETHEIKAR